MKQYFSGNFFSADFWKKLCHEKFLKNLSFVVDFKFQVPPLMYTINAHSINFNPECRVAITNYVCMCGKYCSQPLGHIYPNCGKCVTITVLQKLLLRLKLKLFTVAASCVPGKAIASLIKKKLTLLFLFNTLAYRKNSKNNTKK